MGIACGSREDQVLLREEGRIARVHGGLVAGGNEEGDCGTGYLHLHRALMLTRVLDNIVYLYTPWVTFGGHVVLYARGNKS